MRTTFPFNLHSVTVQGMPVQQYTEQIERLKAQKTEIRHNSVFHLPNPTVRRIVMLRAWHGYSWDGVAAQMSKKWEISFGADVEKEVLMEFSENKKFLYENIPNYTFLHV